MKTSPALIAACGLLVPALAARADFDVVFEHLISNESTPLPILQAQQDVPPDGEAWDGSWVVDSYGGLERYDADRLLLAIRENGINETDADHDAELAAQYPDRSLIWIDPTTGAPMGIALEVGFAPVPLDQDFIDREGSTLDYYFTFAVDAAGVIYVNYKNKIVRYAPEGDGFAAPTVAYTQTDDDSETWPSWRYETLRARGSGADTVLVVGGKTWRPNQGYRELVTEDGLTFEETGVAGFKGGGSSVVPATFGETPTQEWIYGSFYPGGSHGMDTSIVRNVRDTATEEPFTGSEYQFETDEEIGYIGRFISDAEVHPDFPYLVTYSTPSWNSEVRGFEAPVPGWIAVHDQFFDPLLVDPDTGEGLAELIGLHKLDVTEGDELVGAMSIWHGTLGELNLNVLPGMRPGQAELLWHSGAYGYGRYLLDFAPKEVVITDISRVSESEASITWTSEAGKFYAIQTSSSMQSDSWATVVNSIVGEEDGVNTEVFPVDPGAAQVFVRIAPGNVFLDDFESGAEGWTLGTLKEPFPDGGNTTWDLGTPTNVGPESAHSGSNVYATNIDAVYGAFSNITLTTPEIDLTAVERGFFSFWHVIDTSGEEGGQVRVLNEAGEVIAFSEVYTGSNGDWEEVAISLLRFGDTRASIVGQKVRFEFRFLSDDVTEGDGAGWYVDDVRID